MSYYLSNTGHLSGQGCPMGLTPLLSGCTLVNVNIPIDVLYCTIKEDQGQKSKILI